MKTLVFDIDGTLTDMWPIERSVLVCLLKKKNILLIDDMYSNGVRNLYLMYKRVSKSSLSKKEFYILYRLAFSELQEKLQLPPPVAFPLVGWILKNKNNFKFVYATGGQKEESVYVLQKLGILSFFDCINSIDKSNCRYGKKTGIPYRTLFKKFNNCIVITDSISDIDGAILAGLPFIMVTASTKKLSFASK